MSTLQKRIFLNGRVQGVGFRAYVKECAARHNINGWVRNLRDGRVEALLTGTKRGMDLMLIDLQKGPPAAAVSQMEVEDLENRESVNQEFMIKSTI